MLREVLPSVSVCEGEGVTLPQIDICRTPTSEVGGIFSLTTKRRGFGLYNVEKGRCQNKFRC